MKKVIKIVLFSDALGYEVAQNYKFMVTDLPYRYPAETQLGYSATAVPTILCGQPPTVHKHLSFFFYDKDNNSPFKSFRFWQYFMHPRKIFNHHRVRHQISKFLKKLFGWNGYFELYSMPWERLAYFDYCEKNDIYQPNGLNPAENISDMLAKTNAKYFISNWRKTDLHNLLEAEELIKSEYYNFMFIYNGAIDGMLHFHVHDPAYVERYLAEYANKVKQLLKSAYLHYEEVAFYLISDHGMTPLQKKIDLKSIFELPQYTFGKDYIVAYDSTMLRAWFLNPKCKKEMMQSIANNSGHWLSNSEKENFNINFKDNQYGEEIFLVDPGIQIVPSDMSLKPIPGMHGYTPADKDSTASLLSNQKPPFIPKTIAEFFDLMKLEANSLPKEDTKK